MANKTLHVANSPLTNTIYCGSISKDGRLWLSNKQDVTEECLMAVANHVEEFGKPVTLTGKKDVITITVKRESI